MKIKNYFKRKNWIVFFALCIILVAIELSFSFCGKRKCPGFSDSSFDNWFSYTTGQSIVYKNFTGQADTINVISFYKSEAYESSGGFESKSCTTPNASIYARTTDSKIIFFVDVVSTYFPESNMGFGNSNIGIAKISDTGITQPPSDRIYCTTHFQSQIQLNGYSYNNVQEFLVDTFVSKPVVWQFWMAKNKGIIAYKKLNDTSLYLLQ